MPPVTFLTERRGLADNLMVRYMLFGGYQAYAQ